MNKLIISFCALLMPLCANAQVEELFNEPMSKVERQKALKESLISQNLPEENGKAVLRYSTDIPGISKNELYSLLGYWCEKRFEREAQRSEWPENNFFKNIMYSAVKQADRKEGKIKCQGAEEIIVTKKTFVMNWAEFFYTLDITVTDGHIDVVISNIYYVLDAETDRAKLTAEEFVSNKAIVSGRGRFLKNAAKYRVETIKLFKNLLKEIDYVAKSKAKK